MDYGWFHLIIQVLKKADEGECLHTHTYMHTYNLFTFHVNVKQPINFVIFMKRN